MKAKASYWKWDSSLSVGIDVIDEQHRCIVDYINELDEARLEKDPEKVTKVLVSLVDYTITHFAFEEELMSNAGYPLSAPHKRVHEGFIAHISNYKSQHEKGHDIVRKLMSELQLWLTNHIQNEDKHYVRSVNKYLKKQKGWLKRTLGRFFG